MRPRSKRVLWIQDRQTKGGLAPDFRWENPIRRRPAMLRRFAAPLTRWNESWRWKEQGKKKWRKKEMQHVRFYVRLFCRCVQERWRTCRPGREFGFMLRDFFPEKERKRKRKGGMGVEGKKKKERERKKKQRQQPSAQIRKIFLRADSCLSPDRLYKNLYSSSLVLHPCWMSRARWRAWHDILSDIPSPFEILSYLHRILFIKHTVITAVDIVNGKRRAFPMKFISRLSHR